MKARKPNGSGAAPGRGQQAKRKPTALKPKPSVRGRRAQTQKKKTARSVKRGVISKSLFDTKVRELITQAKKLVCEYGGTQTSSRLDELENMLKDAFALATSDADKTHPNREADHAPVEEETVSKPALRLLTDAEVAEVSVICKRWTKEAPAYRGKVFAWIDTNLGKFIPGLTQGHLRANPKLYMVFIKTVARKELPKHLDIPSEPEAARRRMQGVSAEALLLETRERGKLKMRKWVAEQSCQP